jgi:hypothetical protein
MSKSFEDFEKEFKKLSSSAMQAKYRELRKEAEQYGVNKSKLITKTHGNYHRSPEWGPLYRNFMDNIQRPMIVLERLMEARGIEIPKREN